MYQVTATVFRFQVRNLLTGLAGVLLVASCNGSTDRTDRPSAPQTTRASSASKVIKNFSVHTHCGVQFLQASGLEYIRKDGLLGDGHGNSPEGWDNPSQVGELTINLNGAIFTDEHGHRESFRPRTESDPSVPVCD